MNTVCSKLGRLAVVMGALLGALSVSSPASAAEPWGPTELQKQGPSVVVYGEHILLVSLEGTVHAWRTADLTPDPDYRQALANQRIVLLAAGSGALWGTDLMRLYRWSPDARAWTPGAELPRLDQPVLDLVVADGRPLVVYQTRVVDMQTGKVHPVPIMKGPGIRTNMLRALAVHASGARVWIGTGYGEWGGFLAGLDLTTEQWVYQPDSLHYVTGISDGEAGDLWVSWSMSHMFAHMRVRRHHADATVAREYPRQNNSYLQTLAWDGARRTLYGVEQWDLVRLEEGTPVKLVSLGMIPYGEERNAVGVSPGVTQLEVLGPERLLIVSQAGAPLVYTRGALVTLRME